MKTHAYRKKTNCFGAPAFHIASPRLVGLHVLFCAHCHVEFGAKRSTARYCSDACRVAFNRIKNCPVAELRCEQCDKWIDPRPLSGSKTRLTIKYCSGRCRTRAYRARALNQ